MNDLLPRFTRIDEIASIEERVKEAENQLSFGVKFLDKALGGMRVNDLVLLGAKPGAGKTELAAAIAAHNAFTHGKRVHALALEAEKGEWQNRLLYRLVAGTYFATPEAKRPKLVTRLNYMDWYDGLFKRELEAIEASAREDLVLRYETLKVFYRDRDFGLSELKKLILSIKDETDLIVLDHLHYIDMATDKENQEMTEIIKTIRDLVLISGVPMLLVAHLRKPDTKNTSPLPDLEDFHGTSNLGKVVTKGVIIGPGETAHPDSSRFYTMMRAVKNRRDGSRTRYVARCEFDNKTNSYTQAYDLGYFKRDKESRSGFVFNVLPAEELPYWAEKEPVNWLESFK